MNKALFSSVKMDWRTPRAFFYDLDCEFNFGLDAAANRENAKCLNYFTPEDNGNYRNKNHSKTALKRKIIMLRQELLNLERMIDNG